MPKCGGMNKGLDLEETQGWVECSCCNTTFLAPAYASKLLKEQRVTERLPAYTMKAIKP